MKKLACALAATLLASLSFASGGGALQMSVHVPVRFAIRHADPWAIKAMLEGMATDSPEMSSLWGITGTRSSAAASGSPLLENGFLVVNPTDKSTWWYPKAAKP